MHIGKENITEDDEPYIEESGRNAYYDCVTNNFIAIGSIAYKTYKDGGEFTTFTVNSIIDLGIGALPLESSKLNQQSTVQSVFYALDGLTSKIEDDAYFKCTCIECQEYATKIVRHKREIEIAKIELEALNLRGIEIRLAMLLVLVLFF